MNHSFSVEIAKNHGINEAVFLENLFYWIEKNRANKRHFYEGKWWTYNSQDAFAELFPYWNRPKIKRIIASLLDQGLIEKGNFNKLSYDRTTWFALTPKAYKYFPEQKWTMHCPEMDNGASESGQPIPNINSNIKTNKDITKSSFSPFWDAYPIAGRKMMEQTQKNFLKLVKTVNADDVVQAAKNYAASKNGETEFVYASYNFVGQKAYYKDYLPGVYKGKQPSEKKTGGPATSEQWELFLEHGENWREYDAS